ncbi:stonustoxin subunit beta-like isoform X2 [Lissotriton helveticus]
MSEVDCPRAVSVENMALGDIPSIEILPTLGRPFQLGMLYDCRNHAVIPGVSLWDMESIGKDVRVTQQLKSEFKFIASDNFEDKASAMGISGSLKASFLGGLVDVDGAAKYLKETKTTKHQARVTLQYSTTTKFEQLTMKHLGPHNITYPGIFEQDMATHVVTGILYGANAFFVFGHEVSSSESIQDIHMDLMETIKNLQMFPIKEAGKANFNEIEKVKSQKIKCTFCGDFSYQNTITSFEEAITIYHMLPSLLGTNGENAVPVKIWLYPLINLDSRASRLVRSVSPVLLEDVQVVIEELSDIDIQCNDLMTHPVVIDLPHINSKIQQFRNLCKQFRLTFQKDLARVLPAVHGGREGESALLNILTAKDQSPFSSQQLNTFIESKQEEITFVSSYLNVLKELKQVKVLFSQWERSHVLQDPNIELVVSFTFTSLQEEDLHLSDLKHCLLVQYMKTSLQPTSQTPELENTRSRRWFNNDIINQETRTKVKEFIDFARVNTLNKKISFIVSSVPDPHNPGTSIYLYDHGVLINTAFHPPRLEAPTIDRISHDSVWITCTPSPDGRDPILSYCVEYRLMSEQCWNVIEGKDTSKGFTVTGLQPNTLYQFRQSVVTTRWVTLPSDTTDMAQTLPCSPPWNLTGLNETPNSIILTWQEPDSIGVGTRINHYKVEYLEEPKDNNIWLEETTGKKTESYTIERLKLDSLYRFRVSAICENSGSSAPSVEHVFSTSLGFDRNRHMYCFLSHFIDNLHPPEWVICTQKGISFRMDNGMYWSSTPDGIKGQYERDDTCRFQVNLQKSGKVEMLDYKDEYLHPDIGYCVQTVEDRNKPFTDFEVEYKSEKVIFRASNGLFLSRIYYTGIEHTVEARKERLDVFCLFQLIGAEL